MSYHPTTHPIRRLFGRHGLGAIDQAGTGAMAGEYMTSLTPYNITPVQAQYVPGVIVTAMQAAGFPTGYVRSGWSDVGHIYIVYTPATGMTDATRRAALTSAVRAAERNTASDAKLLLPGETAPSGASPTTAPPGTPTSVPSSTSPDRISGGTVGQSVPTSTVQSLLIRKGYTLAGGADNTFGTSTAQALKLALSSIGRYVVIGGHVTTYTVSSDNHAISFSSGTWEALQNAPNASGGGATPTVLPDGMIVATPGAGPDWGAIAPFLIGGGVLVAVGAFFMLKKKPRQKMTVRNPDRFRIFDAGPDVGDRYTIVDTKPNSYKDRPWIKWVDYFGFNQYPFHPQGIGMHGEMTMDQWGEHARERFKTLGKRIYLSDLTGDARKAAEQFMQERGASKRSVASATTKNGRRRSKRNPLPRGYSRKTMGKIIGIERRAGKSPEQASAIAYSVARKAARKAGAHPSYLRSNARGGSGSKGWARALERIEDLFAHMPTERSSREHFDSWVHAATQAEQRARRMGIPRAERSAAEQRGKARGSVKSNKRRSRRVA